MNHDLFLVQAFIKSYFPRLLSVFTFQISKLHCWDIRSWVMFPAPSWLLLSEEKGGIQSTPSIIFLIFVMESPSPIPDSPGEVVIISHPALRLDFPKLTSAPIWSPPGSPNWSTRSFHFQGEIWFSSQKEGAAGGEFLQTAQFWIFHSLLLLLSQGEWARLHWNKRLSGKSRQLKAQSWPERAMTFRTHV